ncbi:MAG: SurA N-terminal domain-containing protein [Thermoanaerobaculia bacterium]
MLKTMRESFHHLKWTLFAVIIVFVLGFVFFSGGGPGSAEQDRAVVARISGQPISAAEFDRLYRSEVERYRQMYQQTLSPEMLRALNMPHRVLNQMIDSRLLLAAAEDMHLTVTDEELARSIAAFPYFQENGQYVGHDRYEKALRAAGLTPDRFERDTRESLLRDKYQTFVKASVVVPEADVKREWSSRNEKATIEYVLVPAARLDSRVEPTEADLKAWLTKGRDRYKKPLQRRFKYLLVDKSKVRGKTVVGEDEIKAEYGRRLSSFSVPEQVTTAHILIRTDPAKGPEAEAAAKARAEKLAGQAKARGADFSKLANETTEDPSGKTSGGQLPAFSRGQMVPEFEEAAFSMQPGEIRGPIKTQFGFHIIKLNAKTPARTRPLEEVKATIASELAEKRAAGEADRIARELATRAHGLRNPSDEQLRKLQTDVVTFNTTDWVSSGEAIPGIGANQAALDEAWKLKVGAVSAAAVSTARGPAVLKAWEERPEGVAPFEEQKPQLTEDWKADRREKDAMARLEPVAKELASGTTLASIAKTYETEAHTTPEFSPGGAVPELGNAPALTAAVFRTPAGQAGKPVAAPGGFVLFRVLTRTPFDQKQFETQKAELVESLRSREADRLLRAYTQQMRAERKIEINEELLKSVLPETSGTTRRG